jgi:hypothetical protein
MRFLKVIGSGGALVVVIVLALLFMTSRGTGVKGVVFYPYCPQPVSTTPCQTSWSPLKAKIRIFSTVDRTDGTSYPGPLLATSETTAAGQFQVTLRPGKYLVSAFALRDDHNSWESEPMLVVVTPWSFVQIRLQVMAVPGAQ